MCWNCLKKTHSFLPHEEWPVSMQRMIIYKTHLNRMQRLNCVCFLVGNGITDQQTIMCLLKNKLRDKIAVQHIKSLIQDAMSDRYDHVWSYYNVVSNCYLFLNGKVDYKVQKKLNYNNLKVCMWNTYASRVAPSIFEQTKYFGEDESINEKVEKVAMV